MSNTIEISKAEHLEGTVIVPGDKSISHRAVMLGALASGDTRITNFLRGADCLSTMACFRKMGVRIDETPDEIIVHGKGLHGLSAPDGMLDTGNSGTTTRLLSGILAGQSFSSSLSGDASIEKRPMRRIIEPLTQMGAHITSMRGNDCAPLAISPAQLTGIHYHTPVASAQVKSAILFAGLYADGETTVTEPSLSRNHSELMLRNFGAKLHASGTSVTICPEPILSGCDVCVPGDISSAAYFIAAGLLVPHARVRIRNVGINPTRDGILRVARMMGGTLSLVNKTTASGEPTADILVEGSALSGVTIGGDLIPTLIDELPVIAVLSSYAAGTTVIRDAAELKVKESNRIDSVAENLRAMGAQVETTDDGMIIEGGHPLTGAMIDSKRDHRIAMSFAVAALGASGTTKIDGADCVAISYPAFFDTLRALVR